MAYTKLFQSIVTSSIWTEDDKTRIVWITMLAIADKNGEIQAAIPGLARLAGVSVNDAETAINKFLSPDHYSRTKDDGGRRIELIDGGWSLLNHGKYRAMASKDEARTANAERQSRFREKQFRNASVTKSNAKVTLSNATVTHDRDIAEAEAEAEAKNKSIVKAKAFTLVGRTADEFTSFWSAYPRRIGKGNAEKAWTKLNPPLAEVLAALEWQRLSKDWLKDGGQFIPHPATWLNRKGWQDEQTEIIRGKREF